MTEAGAKFGGRKSFSASKEEQSQKGDYNFSASGRVARPLALSHLLSPPWREHYITASRLSGRPSAGSRGGAPPVNSVVQEQPATSLPLLFCSTLNTFERQRRQAAARPASEDQTQSGGVGGSAEASLKSYTLLNCTPNSPPPPEMFSFDTEVAMCCICQGYKKNPKDILENTVPVVLHIHCVF